MKRRNDEKDILFAVKEEDEAIGFLCLKETGKATVELAVMGVLNLLLGRLEWND